MTILLYFFGYKTEFSFPNNPKNLEPSYNNPKNLDPSYKTDLDLKECLGRVKLIL